MRQIASEVDLQAGALYQYTPDKQSLLANLMVEHLSALLEEWEAQDQPASPIALLEAFTRFHIRTHLERPDAVFVAQMELRNLSPENLPKINGLRDQYEAILGQILERGAGDKTFAVPDKALATKAILAMLTGVTTWYREDGRLALDRVQRIYWNMVRRAVGIKGQG